MTHLSKRSISSRADGAVVTVGTSHSTVGASQSCSTASLASQLADLASRLPSTTGLRLKGWPVRCGPVQLLMFGQAILSTLGLLLGASKAPAHIEYGDPIVYQNITLVPVHTSETGPFQRYALLEHGLREKSLEVRELAGQASEAQVSQVEVKNSGKLAVFL